MTILVTVQGNIGSGKSTLVERLRKRFNGCNVCFLQEPLDIWNTITDKDGTPMLTLYYGNQKKYAFEALELNTTSTRSFKVVDNDKPTISALTGYLLCFLSTNTTVLIVLVGRSRNLTNAYCMVLPELMTSSTRIIKPFLSLFSSISKLISPFQGSDLFILISK